MATRGDDRSSSERSKIERSNLDGLHPTPGYHHVTVVRAERMVFLAGQCPLAPDGTLLGVARLGFTGQRVELDVTAALR